MAVYLGSNKISPIILKGHNQNKTIRTNGTYTADGGFTGLGQIIVNVPPIFPEFKGLKTVYKINSSTTSGIITDVTYPQQQAEDLLINPNLSSFYFTSMCGFLTNFTFPNTITDLKIDLSFTVLDINNLQVLVGYGGSTGSNIYSCPLVTISSGNININFSDDGLSWALSDSDTGYGVEVNDEIDLSVEFKINNGTVDVTANAVKNSGSTTQILNKTTSATSIAVPVNNLMSLYFGTQTDSTQITSAVRVNMRKTKIIVNGTAMADGTDK